jgi:hypothetical protein
MRTSDISRTWPIVALRSSYSAPPAGPESGWSLKKSYAPWRERRWEAKPRLASHDGDWREWIAASEPRRSARHLMAVSTMDTLLRRGFQPATLDQVSTNFTVTRSLAPVAVFRSRPTPGCTTIRHKVSLRARLQVQARRENRRTRRARELRLADRRGERSGQRDTVFSMLSPKCVRPRNACYLERSRMCAATCSSWV